MESNFEKYQEEIKDLCRDGLVLKYGLRNEMKITISAKELDGASEDMVNRIKKASFSDQYQKWYNASLAAIKQLLPDRVSDFIASYHVDVKKDKDLSNFGIEDYLLGISLTAYSKENNYGFIRNKFDLQYQIVRSLRDRLDSSLFEIKQLMEADLFDSEVATAEVLAKRGFLRGAGAICGVVLEKHLKTVATAHNLKISKKTPTINDLNELLKNNNVIDVAQWRHLQYLGDLRNLCDHDKTQEPTKENLDDLVSGVRKVLKTVN
jgi:hypothetical protein